MSDINYEAYPVYASYSNWEDLAAAQKKEIERLRGELDALQTHFDIKAKMSHEKDAEIERLRSSLKKEQGRYSMRLSIKEAEIERLRSENERLWNLCRNVYGSDRFIREALGE